MSEKNANHAPAPSGIAGCPGCGGQDIRTVEMAAGSLRHNLDERLAVRPREPSPVLVTLEALVFLALAVALAWNGWEEGSTLKLSGGVVAAAVVVICTVAALRSDQREVVLVEAGWSTANRLTARAYYCHQCDQVFCPGDTPWRGMLTPEQFKKLIWTEAGYGEKLTGKARKSEIPAETLSSTTNTDRA